MTRTYWAAGAGEAAARSGTAVRNVGSSGHARALACVRRFLDAVAAGCRLMRMVPLAMTPA